MTGPESQPQIRIRRELRLTVTRGGGLTLKDLRQLIIDSNDAAMPETARVLVPGPHGGWIAGAQVRLDGGDPE